MDLDQERVIIEASRKDPEKFGLLFDKYYETILNYVVRRVGDVAVAQDITSTVFMKAYKKMWQFRWRGLPFVAWLYRIASNEIKTYYRKGVDGLLSLEELKEESGFEPSELQNVEEELIQAEEKLQEHKQFLLVQQEIAQLDPKYQEVLHLRFFENKKIREIGDILGKNTGTVKSLVSRGLKKLRENISPVNEVVEKKEDSQNIFDISIIGLQTKKVIL